VTINGNIVVVGRSGTGKTTCSVLRMFCMESLFNLRVDYFKKKYSYILEDTVF